MSAYTSKLAIKRVITGPRLYSVSGKTAPLVTTPPRRTISSNCTVHRPRISRWPTLLEINPQCTISRVIFKTFSVDPEPPARGSRLPPAAITTVRSAWNRTSGRSGSASEDDPAERGWSRSRMTLGSTPTTPGGSHMTASLGAALRPVAGQAFH